MKTYKAHVRTNGRVVEVRVQARNPMDARDMLSGQYGRDNIVHAPSEVR
jgi:hypothetical protein